MLCDLKNNFMASESVLTEAGVCSLSEEDWKRQCHHIEYKINYSFVSDVMVLYTVKTFGSSFEEEHLENQCLRSLILSQYICWMISLVNSISRLMYINFVYNTKQQNIHSYSFTVWWHSQYTYNHGNFNVYFTNKIIRGKAHCIHAVIVL